MNLITSDKNSNEMRTQVLEASLKGVREFLSSYVRCCEDLEKTFEYVYEGDLQAALYRSIKHSLKNCKWSTRGKWVISNSKKNSKSLIKTNKPCLVHCEQWCRYKHDGKNKGSYIDIAVWDPVEENARKRYYKWKDLLLLIEIKYHFSADDAIKAVKYDCNKLKRLMQKGKRLALTFTIDYSKSIEAELEKSKISFEPVDDIRTALKKENPIQAFVVCRDGIIEIPVKQESK
jgi:hypothetical protein